MWEVGPRPPYMGGHSEAWSMTSASAWGAVWGVGSEGRMTSCAGASWDRGKTDGMEPGTEAGKPGGRFWCRAGCPMP